MKIVIFGLGYVGAVTGACLAEMGSTVVMVDREPKKVEKLNSGKSPISEPLLSEIIARQVSTGQLRATTDASADVSDADFVLISVGTPTDSVTGAADLTAVRAVAKEIASEIKDRTDRVRLALCSTVPPGTTENVFRRILNEEGVSETSYALSFIPEFLREGSAVRDFKEPSRFIVGARSTEEAKEFENLRPDTVGKQYFVTTEVAETLKTTENCWHAVKITFANEIGRICDAYGVDASSVMDLLIQDTRQNVSATYMRPGFSYGGSCLPKDLRSMQHLAAARGVVVPMLVGTGSSNAAHIESAVRTVLATEKTHVALLGLAFKGNTDDLRESPSVELVERLVGKGIEVSIHDFEVDPENLIGANLSTWNRHAHLARMLDKDLSKVVASSDVIILAQHDKRYKELAGKSFRDKIVIDLVKMLG